MSWESVHLKVECHPYDGKEFSKDKPIKELFPAVGEMVFPLSQHIGAPAKFQLLPRATMSLQAS